jgi:hypothetical protein
MARVSAPFIAGRCQEDFSGFGTKKLAFEPMEFTEMTGALSLTAR